MTVLNLHPVRSEHGRTPSNYVLAQDRNFVLAQDRNFLTVVQGVRGDRRSSLVRARPAAGEDLAQPASAAAPAAARIFMTTPDQSYARARN